MDFDTYLIFLITTFVVVFSPGAAAIAVASQGSANGSRRAMFGVGGIAFANVIYFVLSATGIAAIILTSNLLFATIKWVGVGYLVYLGLIAIFSKSGAIKVKTGVARSSNSTLFAQGFVIELANPKALLYFSALLPQFLNTSQSILPQILIMGVTTLILDLCAYSIYAYLGERITRGGIKDWMVKLINRLAGGALLFAAFKMASVNAKN